MEHERRRSYLEALPRYVGEHVMFIARGADMESIGAPHGFVFFPVGGTEETQKALDDIKVFIDGRL